MSRLPSNKRIYLGESAEEKEKRIFRAISWIVAALVVIVLSLFLPYSDGADQAKVMLCGTVLEIWGILILCKRIK